MNKPRFIFRIIFFLLVLFLLVYISQKMNDNTISIVEFKLKTIHKDVLDSKQSLELVIKDTSKFIDNSSHTRKGIHDINSLIVLWSLPKYFS